MLVILYVLVLTDSAFEDEIVLLTRSLKQEMVVVVEEKDRVNVSRFEDTCTGKLR